MSHNITQGFCNNLPQWIYYYAISNHVDKKKQPQYEMSDVCSIYKFINLSIMNLLFIFTRVYDQRFHIFPSDPKLHLGSLCDYCAPLAL